MRVGGIPPPSYSKPGPVARLRQRRLQSHQQNPPRRSTQPRNFEVGYYKLFQNWVQSLNSEVVGFTEMRDKQGQQRRWRADGAIRSSVDRRPVGEDAALAGRICPKSSPRQPRAGADCATGRSKVSGSISGGRFWQNSTNGNNCSGASPSWTGVLLPPKKGHWSRKTKRGKGTK